MARRRDRKPLDPSFGSDSFLDIVANIVGILIILIVIVGVRVKNAPTQSDRELERARAARLEKQEQELQRWRSEKERIERQNLQGRIAYEQSLAQRNTELARRTDLDQRRRRRQEQIDRRLQGRLAEIASNEATIQQYREEAARLEREVAELARQFADEKDRQASERVKNKQIASQLTGRQARLADLRLESDRELEELERHKTEGDALRAQILALREQVAKLRSQRKPPRDWVHYATPIAKRVKKEESHYRCLKGRVADIHMNELIQRIATDTSREALIRNSVVQNVVGPIEGFRMRYVLRRSVSLTSMLQSPYSVGVEFVGFEIVGDTDELGETREQALRQGSKFLGSLERRPAERYAVTLWVYPDSFRVAKDVEVYLHEHGYSVAIRPLPNGYPIAGSPAGSASRSQ